MSEVVKKAWNIYMLQLQLHPLRTKVITSGVLAGFQDLYSQKSSGIKKLQLRRLLLLMLYGFAYGGPFDYCCQKLTDFIFKGKNDIKTYAKKGDLGGQLKTKFEKNTPLYSWMHGRSVSCSLPFMAHAGPKIHRTRRLHFRFPNPIVWASSKSRVAPSIWGSTNLRTNLEKGLH